MIWGYPYFRKPPYLVVLRSVSSLTSGRNNSRFPGGRSGETLPWRFPEVGKRASPCQICWLGTQRFAGLKWFFGLFETGALRVSDGFWFLVAFLFSSCFFLWVLSTFSKLFEFPRWWQRIAWSPTILRNSGSAGTTCTTPGETPVGNGWNSWYKQNLCVWCALDLPTHPQVPWVNDKGYLESANRSWAVSKNPTIVLPFTYWGLL